MSGQIFVSYRRDDSQGSTGRLCDHLAARFGRDKIFMDVDTIQPGADFAEAIEEAVSDGTARHTFGLLHDWARVNVYVDCSGVPLNVWKLVAN